MQIGDAPLVKTCERWVSYWRCRFMSGNTQQVRLLARHRPPVVSGFFVLWIMPERARNVVRRLRHPSMDSPSPSGVRECRL